MKTPEQLANDVAVGFAAAGGSPKRCWEMLTAAIRERDSQHEQAAQQRIAEAVHRAIKEAIHICEDRVTQLGAKAVGENEPVHLERLNWRRAEAAFLARAIEEAAKR